MIELDGGGTGCDGHGLGAGAVPSDLDRVFQHQVACIMQVKIANVRAPWPNRPSRLTVPGCPVNISLEVFGDRWSLLIVRDLMVRGLRTFRDFEHAGEGNCRRIFLRTGCVDCAWRGLYRPNAIQQTGGRKNYPAHGKGNRARRRCCWNS